MVIFLYSLYIFGIHLCTLLYPKPCYNEPFYKEVNVYNETINKRSGTATEIPDKYGRQKNRCGGGIGLKHGFNCISDLLLHSDVVQAT